jgi:hypothetical protein
MPPWAASPSADEDVLAYDLTNGTWSLVIDGSDLGFGINDIDGLHRLSDGRFLISLERDLNLGSLGMVDDSELLEFIPTSLGSTTSGTLLRYLDGTDVGTHRRRRRHRLGRIDARRPSRSQHPRHLFRGHQRRQQ